MTSEKKLPYLPMWATLTEAAEWLSATTGELWSEIRVMDTPLHPYLEIERPDNPTPEVLDVVFNGKQSIMAFIMWRKDLDSFIFRRDGGTFQDFHRDDGFTFRSSIPIPFSMSDLRYKRADLEKARNAVLSGTDLHARNPLTLNLGPYKIRDVDGVLAASIALEGGPEALEGATISICTGHVPIGGERVAQRPEKVDFSLLATPDELITAFGAFTGMDASWFRKITDKPRLHEARRFAGTRGKGGTKPLFCPLAVMLWLIGPRKVGRTMSASKGWEMLEKHFPRVYSKYSVGDPRESD